EQRCFDRLGGQPICVAGAEHWRTGIAADHPCGSPGLCLRPMESFASGLSWTDRSFVAWLRIALGQPNFLHARSGALFLARFWFYISPQCGRCAPRDSRSMLARNVVWLYGSPRFFRDFV